MLHAHWFESLCDTAGPCRSCVKCGPSRDILTALHLQSFWFQTYHAAVLRYSVVETFASCHHNSLPELPLSLMPLVFLSTLLEHVYQLPWLPDAPSRLDHDLSQLIQVQRGVQR